MPLEMEINGELRLKVSQSDSDLPLDSMKIYQRAQLFQIWTFGQYALQEAFRLAKYLS
jgi:hypothetical protein